MQDQNRDRGQQDKGQQHDKGQQKDKNQKGGQVGEERPDMGQRDEDMGDMTDLGDMDRNR